MSNDLPLSKEKILDAAEQVLRRFGPDKTSVVDVAKVLKVSHGTLYRHFSSKSALREAVTERWLQYNISEPLKNISEHFDGNAKEQLRLWMDTLIRSKRTYAVDDAEMFAMYAAVTLEAVDMITLHVDQLIGQIAGIIEKGIQSKEYRVVEPVVTARAIFNATSRYHHPAHAIEWQSATIDQDFASVWDLLLSGISL
ncbi:TetR family transcriptional regulator [Paenibacillus sp. FSL L8-0493]|uniref:TetR family transcriptional regulator n=1 Tax=Paenibacillus TaxID=44249 RepID=UPI00096C6FB0|nr:TetR family transcriptional regulator [Paenibacillus odorifer]OMD09003.1 TetR family transcriptional regulator [Paenibacillus odorifer]OMD23730.1 TetR family transcriptional regulator [Paenibacillus odorifer]OME43379.1 TetR family transcriptional regulator [Paenibacillus odorifer]